MGPGAQPLVNAVAAGAPRLAAGVAIDAATGCPEGRAITAGEHCVPWDVEMYPQTIPGPGGCAEALFMKVPLNRDVDEYLALWSWDTPAARAHPWLFTGPGSGPYGEEAWSTTALTPQNTGVNVHYDVPAGFGAWFVAAGGGPGPCDAQTGSAQAWAVTYKWEVSGQVTFAGSGDPAPGITVNADCPGGGADTTNNNGGYRFLLGKGPCTIAPAPPGGEDVSPEKRVLDVEGNITDANFQLTGTLYFKVQKGLSVKSNSSAGAGLVKAGTAFTEQVTLKDVSKTKAVLVAPIYPALSGNADGGALQPVGGVIQHQLSSTTVADPSPIVVLRPGQEQVFDSVIATTASRSLGTEGDGQKVSGGTRAYVQFSVPRAFVLSDDDQLTPLDPRQIEVAPGSTDKTAVGIDDSAPDQTPFNAYLATYDIAKGLVVGSYHVFYGLVHGVLWDLPILAAKGIMSIPTALINYVTMEGELWQECQDNPAEMAAFLNIVTNTTLLVYKQAPFLLKKLGDIKASLDAAAYKHFNDIETDWRSGDWEAAVTQWSQDSTEFFGNAATLFVNPGVIAGAIGDATIARVPGLLKALYVADETKFAKDAEEVTVAIGTGEAAGEVTGAETALKEMVPGLPLIPAEMANVYGISQKMFNELAAFCEKYDVLVTLRSRSAEAISLIEAGLSAVKPAAIKLKTVTQLDVDFLGFPKNVVLGLSKKVSSIGQVLVREPIYLSADCAAACALAKLQAEMIARGVERGSAKWYEVQSRWAQRYGEWVSPGKGYIGNLDQAAKEGKLTLDWHWGENHIDPNLTQSPQTVLFRMANGGDGVRIPEVFVNGSWKSITGDVDLVSVTAADGSPLSDKAYVHLLQELGATSVDIQHPATATWYDDVDDTTSMFDPTDPAFADKAKYLQADKCCVMQVGPDGKARAVRLDLNGSTFASKNDYHLNYVGGYLNAAP
jgi:hypothetical protein